MNPLIDEQVARACIAADALEDEIRQLVRIWRRMDTLLRERSLTEVQREKLEALIYLVEVRQTVMAGNWAIPDHLQRRNEK